jgi:prefoldin subunit 5
MESYLVNKEAPLPYEIEKIAAERNAIRDTINALEAEIEALTKELE